MLNFLKLADDIFQKYDCGSIEETEQEYVLRLDSDSWLKASTVIHNITKIHWNVDIKPRLMDGKLSYVEYLIWKARTPLRRYEQELFIATAAMLAAEKFLSGMFQDNVKM